jgi:hypothetical protein
MYGNRSAFGLTCEIYAYPNAYKLQTDLSELAHLRGAFLYYNPDPSNIENVVQRWLPVLSYISNRAIAKNEEHLQTLTTLKVESPSAAQGKPVILKACLRDVYGNPVEGAKVELQILSFPSWKQIGSAYTDSNGIVSLSYTPPKTGEFQVRAFFNGDTEHSESISEAAILYVHRDFSLYITFGYMSLALGVTVGCPGAYAFYRKKKIKEQLHQDQYEHFMSRWNAFLEVIEEEQSKRRTL